MIIGNTTGTTGKSKLPLVQEKLDKMDAKLDRLLDAEVKLQEISHTVTENGSLDMLPSDEYDGISQVHLTVDVQPRLVERHQPIGVNGTHYIDADEDIDGFSRVVVDVNVPQTVDTSLEDFIGGALPLETIELPNIIAICPYAFYDRNIKSISMPNVRYINLASFALCEELELTSLPPHLISILSDAFMHCNKITKLLIPASVTAIYSNAFGYCAGLTSVTFEGTPQELYYAFQGCDNLTEINVPWSEGEVSGAPWGADYATINYNCKIIPSDEQLIEGYSYDFAQTYPSGAMSGTPTRVGDIADESTKAAILAYGKTEDDYVHLVSPGGVNANATIPLRNSAFVAGRKYNISVTYYTATGGGGGQYLLALDGSPSNHNIGSGMFTKTVQVATSNCTWVVSENDYQLVWFGTPPDLYILDLSIQLDTSVDYHYTRYDTIQVTAAGLGITGGYVYDFSEGSNPVSGKHFWIDVANLSEAQQAAMTAENGFGATVMHIQNELFSFADSISEFELNTSYTFKARIYCESNSIGNILLLPMNSVGMQSGNHGNPYYTQIADNIYDVEWTIFANEDVTTAQFYGTPAHEFFIGRITVTPKYE